MIPKEVIQIEITVPIFSEPYWAHDSECCTFLGQIHPSGRTVDLYYCGEGDDPHLLARTSNEPSEYLSTRKKEHDFILGQGGWADYVLQVASKLWENK